MEKVRINIAVTGLNAIDNPGPGVGVIRAIRDCEQFDPRIIGLSYETMEPGAYLHDIVDKSYQIPYPSAGSERLLDRLLYIHSQEKIDLIVPNFDAELRNFIKIAPRLQSIGIQTFLPTHTQMELVAKNKLHEFAASNGFRMPKTMMLNSLEDVENVEEEFDYPASRDCFTAQGSPGKVECGTHPTRFGTTQEPRGHCLLRSLPGRQNGVSSRVHKATSD